MANQSDASIRLDCDCGCTILNVDFDKFGEEPALWGWHFFTCFDPKRSFRERLIAAWSILRGKDQAPLSGTVHNVEDMERLQNFLTETLPK